MAFLVARKMSKNGICDIGTVIALINSVGNKGGEGNVWLYW
jgi:hypothetical protein